MRVWRNKGNYVGMWNEGVKEWGYKGMNEHRNEVIWE